MALLIISGTFIKQLFQRGHLAYGPDLLFVVRSLGDELVVVEF